MIGIGLAPGAPSTSTLMWHYLLQFTLMTTGVIALLYGAFWWLKRNPQTLQMLQDWVQNRFGTPHNRQNNRIGAQAAFRPRPASQSFPQPLFTDNVENLWVEAATVLDEHTTLFVVQCDGQRYLVSSGPPGAKRLATLPPLDDALADDDSAGLPRTAPSSPTPTSQPIFQSTLTQAAYPQPQSSPSTETPMASYAPAYPSNPMAAVAAASSSNVHPSLRQWFDGAVTTPYSPA
jgi:hypothetical protein